MWVEKEVPTELQSALGHGSTPDTQSLTYHLTAAVREKEDRDLGPPYHEESCPLVHSSQYR